MYLTDAWKSGQSFCCRFMTNSILVAPKKVYMCVKLPRFSALKNLGKCGHPTHRYSFCDSGANQKGILHISSRAVNAVRPDVVNLNPPQNWASSNSQLILSANSEAPFWDASKLYGEHSSTVIFKTKGTTLVLMLYFNRIQDSDETTWIRPDLN